MSGPEVVRIKRKRSEQAPEALLVERPGKRQHTTDVHYILQKDSANGVFDAAKIRRLAEPRADQAGRKRAASGNGLDGSKKERRTYHLKRPSTPEAGVKKRKHKDDGIATFVEKQIKRNVQDLMDLAQRERPPSNASPPLEAPLKRPGRGAAVRYDTHASSATGPSSSKTHVRTNSHIEVMANSLHQFALEEVAREVPLRPTITSQPKLSPHRSRELHRQRTATSVAPHAATQANGGIDVDEDSDYVYDTYVLAPSSDVGATQMDSHTGAGSVGYLVITEEDEDVWGTYMEDDPSDPSDEDDENAEDWYGADYPDDELASDDEFDRNPYHYRKNGSDDEWEERPTFSDDEYERQTQPWRKKTPGQYSKYFSGIENEVEE